MRGLSCCWCTVTVLLVLASLHAIVRCEDDSTKEDDEEAVDDNLYEDDNDDNRPLDDFGDDEQIDFEKAENLDDLDDIGEEDSETNETKPQDDRLYKGLLMAMRRPGMERRMGEVMTIIRAMSPPQRLALAALLTAQALRSNGAGTKESLDTVQQMFGIKEGDDEERRRNITASLMLPISWDIANMFRGAAASGRAMRNDIVEAQGLRYFREGYHHRRGPKPPVQPNRPRYRTTSFRPPGLNRRNSLPDKLLNLHPPPPPLLHTATTLTPTKFKRPPPNTKGQSEDPPFCKPFANNMCLEVDEYPSEAIMASLERNQGAMEALLLDNKQKSEEEFESEMEIDRRQDHGNDVDVDVQSGGFMCPSTVKYARPKRARATSGLWKYIVNTGEYTQTLRLEMCTRPQKSCAFISENFRSECTQVYNYHRLLSWDNAKGLHMDIFKVPTCCSCYVKGYSQFFPPIDSNLNGEGKHQERFPGEVILQPDGNLPGDVDGGGHFPNEDLKGPFRNQETSVRQESYPYRQEIRNGYQPNRGQGFGQSAEDFEIHRSTSAPFQTKYTPPHQHHPQNYQAGGHLRSPIREQPVYEDYQPPLRNPYPPQLPPPPQPPTHNFPGEYVHNQIRRSRNQTNYRSGDQNFGASEPAGVHPQPALIPSNQEIIRRTASIASSVVVGAGLPSVIANNTNKVHITKNTIPQISPSSPDKINYNYHPIIDFFKNHQESGRIKERAANNLERAPNNLERAPNMADWTPIVVQQQEDSRTTA